MTENAMKTFFEKFGVVAAVVLGLNWGSPNSGEAATANVSVINNAFVPATTNINPGDTVLWTWPSGSNFHNVTSQSTPQAWPASFTLSGPATFTNTFTTSGTYPYICTVHQFTGSIVVNASVTPPTVNITSPTNGTVYATPANVTIHVTASESGGTITNVQFRVNSNVLTNETSGTFTATTNIQTGGSYSLSAVASDSTGVKATNSVTINVVAPSPLMLSAAARSGTNFRFMYSADAGLSYIVQRSTNLLSTSWTTLVTNMANGSSVNFTDVNATASPGFYRVSRLPNP